MGTFTIYGGFLGTRDEEYDVIGFAQTFEDAQMAVDMYQQDDPLVEYDFYIIAEDIGGVRFATFA